jgi:hypothetical protein
MNIHNSQLYQQFSYSQVDPGFDQQNHSNFGMVVSTCLNDSSVDLIFAGFRWSSLPKSDMEVSPQNRAFLGKPGLADPYRNPDMQSVILAMPCDFIGLTHCVCLLSTFRCDRGIVF